MTSPPPSPPDSPPFQMRRRVKDTALSWGCPLSAGMPPGRCVVSFSWDQPVGCGGMDSPPNSEGSSWKRSPIWGSSRVRNSSKERSDSSFAISDRTWLCAIASVSSGEVFSQNAPSSPNCSFRTATRRSNSSFRISILSSRARARYSL